MKSITNKYKVYSPICHIFSTWNPFSCACVTGDERRPWNTQGGEAGASVQAQRNNTALPGGGGSSPAGPAEAGLRPELQGPQTPESGQEAGVWTGASERGKVFTGITGQVVESDWDDNLRMKYCDFGCDFWCFENNNNRCCDDEINTRFHRMNVID